MKIWVYEKEEFFFDKKLAAKSDVKNDLEM
jgi:hypothetical protein